MQLGQQIKKYRHEYNFSQEELSERIYVSRQTISNWENDKSYPDINSLVLLSEIFHISLDELVKGDIEKMKNEIKKEDVLKLNHYAWIYVVLLLLVIISIVPLFKLLKIWAIIPWSILYIIAMIFAFKIEKIKKENNIQAYKEIIAFSEGKRLDEIQKQREIGKRNYQKVLLAISIALITIIVSIVIGLLIN